MNKQRPHCQVGDQACNDKCAAGKQLRRNFRIGTWNVRRMKEHGKVNTVYSEMDRNNIDIPGICETNWTNKGSFQNLDDKLIIFTGKDGGDSYSHGVAAILCKETNTSLLEYSPISDRLLKLRLQVKPYNIRIIQCYAPTSAASDEEMEQLYNSLQDKMDSVPNRDVKIIMGDCNAKVGKLRNSKPICGKFGLGDQNERGADLLEFCQSNNHIIANTLFEYHPRHLYTWASPDSKIRSQIDCIIINEKWKRALKNAKTRPGADCNTDHQLLVVDMESGSRI